MLSNHIHGPVISEMLIVAHLIQFLYRIHNIQRLVPWTKNGYSVVWNQHSTI